MIVADVGAGSGWLAWPLSKKVGARGKVLALDINQVAVRMMKEKKRRSPPPHDNLIVIHSHPEPSRYLLSKPHRAS